MIWCIEGIPGSDAPSVADNLQALGRTVLRFPWQDNRKDIAGQGSSDGFYECLRLAWYLSVARNSHKGARYILHYPLNAQHGVNACSRYHALYARLHEKIRIAYGGVFRIYVYTDPTRCARRRPDGCAKKAKKESEAMWKTYFALYRQGKKAYVI